MIIIYDWLVKIISPFKKHWREIVSGQLLSFLLALNGATNSIMSTRCNFSVPTTQIGIMYFILSWHLLYIYYRSSSSQNGFDHVVSSDQLFISSGNQYHDEVPRKQTDGDDDDGDDDHEGMRISSNNISTTDSYDDDESAFSNNNISTYRFLGYISINHSPYTYMFMAFIDLQANYFTYLAFRYTTLPSVSLLDALALPSAMLFSYILLNRSYRSFHCIGAFICLVGVGLNVVSDYDHEKANSQIDVDDEISSSKGTLYPYELFGDGLAIVGAIFYGLSNTWTEKVVKTSKNNIEYLGMLGFFGTIMASIQAILLERSQWSKFSRFKLDDPDLLDSSVLHCTPEKTILLFTSCIFLTTTVYISLSRFLISSEAAFFNISMLTADFWAVFLGESLNDIIPSSLFWIALLLSLLGVVIYEMGPSPIDDSNVLGTVLSEDEVELTKVSVSVIS